MSKAILVSLNTDYPQITAQFRNATGQALHHCTTNSWLIDTLEAIGSEWVLGLVGKKIVSAYQIAVPSDEWPTVPEGAGGAGHRIIPAMEGDPESFDNICSFELLGQLYGSVGYAEIDFDAGTVTLHSPEFHDGVL